MIVMTALQIADAIGARMVAGDPAATADSVSIDSRSVGKGGCFVAIAGERHDGHDFLADAVKAGATVLVIHRPFVGQEEAHTGGAALLEVNDTTTALQRLATHVRSVVDPTLVAITGSLGKTTTKELTTSILRSRYAVHSSPGNLNNHWGLPLSLLGLEETHEVMVAELAMSSAGEIRALAQLATPDIGVITNIAPAHMENFADLEAVAAAKGELAEELADTATLIVNADDERTAALGRSSASRLDRVVTFGAADDADVQAAGISQDAGSWHFTLRLHGDQLVDITLAWPGRAGLANFLAAAAVATTLDVPAGSIADVASRLEPLPNRGAIRRLDGITLLDETYNASPVAVATALRTLAGLPAGGRRVAVLGDMLEMGSWTESVHREAGAQAAAAGIQLFVAVGAQAAHMADGAVQAGLDADAIEQFDSSIEAAEWLAPRLRSGDTVLVKGSRSVHMERVVEAIATTTAVANGG